MLFSVEQAFVGREEIRSPLKTPAGEASMELSRRLFFISLGAADFVTYDQREVFFPTPFCQENVII